MEAASDERTFTADAKVMAKGQVTIPKDIREVLGVGTGDRVTFVADHGKVTVVNSAAFAMKYLQDQLQGEAERLGLKSEQDACDLMKAVRDEDQGADKSEEF